MNKEILSVKELRLVVSSMWEIHTQRNELHQMFFDDEKGILVACPYPFSWSQLYDYRIDQLATMLLVTVDQEGELVTELSKYSSILDLQRVFDSYSDLEPIDLGEGVDKTKYQFLAIWVALMRTLESIQVYGRSFQRMLVDIKNGSDKALFDAVKLDHSLMGHSIIQRRISIAELKQEKKFFAQLANTLKRRPVKYSSKLYPVRYILALLDELGQLDYLTEESAYQLFCVELNIYSYAGDDPSRSLWQFIYRWKKENRNPYST